MRDGLRIVFVRELAAFCVAEKTDEKKPLEAVMEAPGPIVPPGDFASSIVGVRGTLMAFESLLGGLLPARARREVRVVPGEDFERALGVDC